MSDEELLSGLIHAFHDGLPAARGLDKPKAAVIAALVDYEAAMKEHTELGWAQTSSIHWVVKQLGCNRDSLLEFAAERTVSAHAPGTRHFHRDEDM